YEVAELTRRGVVGVWTHGFYDGWAPNYLIWAATGHNAIGRFYETFGNRGADTQERTLQPNATSREWFRPNPPLAKVKWSARDNVNLQQSGLLLGLYNVASHGQEYLQNFYLKSLRSIAKARTEGPAAWVLPADDARVGDQARLLNVLRGQGIEISRADKAFSAAVLNVESAAIGGPGKAADEKKAAADEKPPTTASTTTVVKFPAGSYIIRMDQPYSRLADTLLDTQYFSAKDPRPYDDTGWTLGALANVKTVRVMDASVLDAPMAKVAGEIAVAGAVKGGGHTTYLIDNNTDSALATFRFRLASVAMEAAEEPFEADGHKFNRGTFVIAKADRDQIEAAARDLGISVFATDAKLTVARHALEAPRVALLHNWTNTQEDGWFRITLDQLKIPYTYVADTKIRETPSLRDRFDVVVVPPFAGNLASAMQGLPMQGNPMPWKGMPETPSFAAPGLDSSDDIRGGFGYAGIASLERFVREGGLLIAVGESAALPVEGGMTRAVSLRPSQKLVCPGDVLQASVEDAKSPIVYGYGDKLYLYYSENPVLNVSLGFGGGEEGNASRPSGRGSASDPDVIQGRPYVAPEKPPKRTPREKELYVPEEVRAYAAWRIPPDNELPRVILRFAEAKDLLVSGLLDGGPELAEKPAVVDVPHGQGHIVLFSNNPMWRNETSGSHFLLFNAIMNYRHLDVGREKRTENRSQKSE
ncbi:MAG TPA: hypothetical protein VN924_20000, partial [Bryobacteraceae bacterium]|nr:hypothetical protein [Bryobacteraceae bacterium]